MDYPHTDFDGAWKEALERFFEPFMAFFFPQAHSDIDWTHAIAFRDTELQQVAPEQQQGKHYVDKLVRVMRLNGTGAWVLVHIEIQSQRDTAFAERMFRYHARLYDRERRQIVSLAVLGDTDATWQPDEFGYTLWGCDLTLRFPVVKLLDLDRALLETSQNIFALLVLMHRDAQETRTSPATRMQRKLERYRYLLRHITTPEDMRSVLRLMEYLLRLPPDLARQTQYAMKHIENEEVGMAFVTSFEEVAQRDLIVRQLTRKLGSVSDETRNRIDQLSQEALLALADALLDFTNQQDLTVWLDHADQSETQG